MTKSTRKKMLVNLLIAWAVMFGVGALFHLRTFIIISPVFLIVVAAFLLWETLPVIKNELKQNKTKKK